MATTPRPDRGATDPTPHLREGDGIALVVFAVLIALGMVAAVISFARM